MRVEIVIEDFIQDCLLPLCFTVTIGSVLISLILYRRTLKQFLKGLQTRQERKTIVVEDRLPREDVEKVKYTNLIKLYLTIL